MRQANRIFSVSQSSNGDFSICPSSRASRPTSVSMMAPRGREHLGGPCWWPMRGARPFVHPPQRRRLLRTPRACGIDYADPVPPPPRALSRPTSGVSRSVSALA